MQIPGHSLDLQFHGHDPSEAAGDGRDLLGEHGTVGHQEDIRLHQFRLLPHQPQQALAANLLLTLNDKEDVQGDFSVNPPVAFQGFQIGVDLSLVIVSSPGVYGTVPDGWLKRWGDPLLHRHLRLNVVMAVDQKPGRTGAVRVLRHDNGPALRLPETALKPQRPELFQNPLCRLFHVLPPVRIGADPRDPQEITQLPHVFVHMAVNILKEGLIDLAAHTLPPVSKSCGKKACLPCSDGAGEIRLFRWRITRPWCSASPDPCPARAWTSHSGR